jgi:hypothetical protein
LEILTRAVGQDAALLTICFIVGYLIFSRGEKGGEACAMDFQQGNTVSYANIFFGFQGGDLAHHPSNILILYFSRDIARIKTFNPFHKIHG